MAWTKVANVGEIPVGTMKCVTIEEDDIAVYHLADGFYATSDTCTHASQSLSVGTLVGNIIACPKHGGKFDVKTGAATAFPCVISLQTYDVEVRDDDVWIAYEW